MRGSCVHPWFSMKRPCGWVGPAAPGARPAGERPPHDAFMYLHKRVVIVVAVVVAAAAAAAVVVVVVAVVVVSGEK